MGTAQRVAELEHERAELRSQLDLTIARLGAVDHELKLLRQVARPGGDLAEMKLTDAIVTILRNDGGTMTPKDIQARLADGGREEPLNKITATLKYLGSQSRVVRQGRGRYLAT